jgi:hypothetical protein
MLIFALLALLPWVAHAHTRFTVPTPRSDNPGIKGPAGTPCGSLSTYPPRTPVEVSPGNFTIRFQETIRHAGTPWRFALSRETTAGDATWAEMNECILIDHIPHPPQAVSYDFYEVVLDIPDVECDHCVLQLLSLMTDKTGGQPCTYRSTMSSNDGDCASIYHTCVDIKITGTTPRNDYTCPARVIPVGAPQDSMVYYSTETDASVWGGSGDSSDPWKLFVNGDAPSPASTTVTSTDPPIFVSSFSSATSTPASSPVSFTTPSSLFQPQDSSASMVSILAAGAAILALFN